MKPFVALAVVLFVANNLLAGPYSEAIQQAKNVSANETEANRKLLDNQPPPAPPAAIPNSQANPALQATLENIQNLRHDFAAIGNGAAAGASPVVQRQSLTNDLAVAAQDRKPQAASISKLADDLTTAIAGKEKLRAPPPALAQYVHAIFNSSHLTASQEQMIFDGVQKILTNGGASPDEAANVVNDIKAIASETK